MKKLLIVFALYIPVMAQLPFITKVPKTAEEQVIEKIINIEDFLNTGNIHKLNVDDYENFITKDCLTQIKNYSYTHVDYKDLKILIQNLSIKQKTATVNILISFSNEYGLLEQSVGTLVFKETSNWKLSEMNGLENKFISKLKEEGIGEGSIEVFNIITPILNDNTFKQVPVFTPQGAPDIYEVNYSLTLEKFNDQLFAANQGLSWAGWYWPHTNGQDYYKIGLILDNGWKRIVFSRDALDGVISLHDYGRWPGNIAFQSPRSIDMNEFNEVFVADDENKCIYKLIYNFNANTIITGSPSIFISNSSFISKPVDIDYHSGLTYNNRADDRFVIADEGLNCISIFDGSGNFKGKITQFFVSGVGYVQISKPRSVVLYDLENPPYKIAFIDGGTNSLVCGRLYDNLNYVSPFSPPSKFEGNSKLYDIGVDGCYNLLVTDVFGQKIHKFSKTGVYSCSYNQNMEIINPYFASNLPNNCNASVVGMHFFIGASWGRNNGITEYLPGADVINLTNTNYNNYYKFQFFSTDEIDYKVELIKTANNQVISVWDNQTAYTAKQNFFTRTQNGDMSNGNYKWRITYRPLYDDYYPPNQVGWQTKEITFNHTNVAPIINNLVVDPNPICRGYWATISCNLSQGNGEMQYFWTKTNFPSDFIFETDPFYLNNYCRVFIPAQLNKSESLKGNIPQVSCKAQNGISSDTKIIELTYHTCVSGCPTLAFNQNGTLIDENPLLITSMSNPDKDVTDYYLVNTPITINDNKINLTIHEPQTEHTWFDNISLLETRADPDEMVVVNDEGQVINYKGVLPATIILNGQTDITENLLSLDSSSIHLFPGDVLTVTRATQSIESDGDIVVGGEGPPGAKDRPFMNMNVLTKINIDANEKSSVIKSFPITNFFLRPNKSIISKKLRNLPLGTIEITVNKELTLDYFVFVSNLRSAKTRVLPLLSAIHNIDGDIKSQIAGIDQNYSELFPEERIDLSYSTNNSSTNRAYILKTVGRYVTDTTYVAKQNNLTKQQEQPIVPTENKLYDNYPNPFNPSTTIKYSLLVDGKVTLKIFNTLGEEIKTLVDEIKPAGIYSITFNASTLPSGVYIYRIQAGDFVNSKKMILLK